MVEISKVVKDDGAGTDNDDGKDETPCNNADAATVGESESPIPESGENKEINAVQEKGMHTIIFYGKTWSLNINSQNQHWDLSLHQLLAIFQVNVESVGIPTFI